MRTIGVVTVSRSDYGIYRPVLEEIARHASLEARLFVAGAHLDPVHGETVREIEADGHAIEARVELTPAGDSGLDCAGAIGRGVAGFAEAFARSAPDLLLVLGDRFEMLAAAVAALPLRIPLAHVHGGEVSEGAFDDSIRHGVTKLSHLHFASAAEHARRIVQLGEEPWRVIVSGAPALDAIRAEHTAAGDALLEERLGRSLDGITLLVTYHPETLDVADPAERAAELVAAVDASGHDAVFTYPNADPGGSRVRELVEDYVRDHPRAVAVPSLGAEAYHALLRRAAAMVGNSSSGLIEAPSFELPVVNVGRRQEGRLRAANVLDVEGDRDEILAGIRRAVSPEFRSRLAGLVNPYGDGHAAERIVRALAEVEVGPQLLVKRFHDLHA